MNSKGKIFSSRRSCGKPRKASFEAKITVTTENWAATLFRRRPFSWLMILRSPSFFSLICSGMSDEFGITLLGGRN